MSSIATRSFAAFRNAWYWFLAVGLVWLSQTGICLAQGLQKEEKTKNYVPAYMIIMFAVAGGLFVICRPSRRQDKVRKP